MNKGRVALVDDEDYERVNRHKWHVQVTRNGVAYAATNIVIQVKPRKVKKIRMHRLVLNAGPSARGVELDHWNGDGLDNQKSNLRITDTSANQQNQHHLSRNTSGFRGVTLHKNAGKWQAAIRRHGKKHHLGLHATAEAAARAYDAGAVRLFGPNARLNFGG